MNRPTHTHSHTQTKNVGTVHFDSLTNMSKTPHHYESGISHAGSHTLTHMPTQIPAIPEQ